MESNDDENLKAIKESVGRLVWVRRRNGSWWPGQTLVHEEVPENSLVSPKDGTPIKLLGRDDVSVDWYILEKSKMVKPFRCGEYDACIDKAKAAAAVAASSSNKKTVKCSRREDAINDALEIENAHLVAIEDHPESGEEEEDSKRCVSSKDDEETESDDAGEAEDELDSAPEQLQSSMSSQEMNNVEASSKVQTKRRRTPNDSEDDGTEGIKRMRGLEDIGKEQVGAVLKHRQEMGLVCCDSLSNGNVLANGNKVCSPLSLKRKRSQVMNVNECTKRKNRRRQLTKVLESTAMVCVPVTCDQLVVASDCQGIYDSKVPGMESVESMKSVSVVINNNNSDSTGVSCENASVNVVGASRNNKAKDSEISSVSVSATEDDSADRLFDVPLTGEEKHSLAFPAAKRALVSNLTRRRGRSSSHDVFVKKEGSNGTACTSPPATQSVNGNSNGVEKSASKWQLKGKRNSRQMSKKQEAKRNVNGEEANNEDSSSLPLSELHEVNIVVKANYSKPRNVPLVSRMSELHGKAIVGHPLTVEVLEEGCCDGVGTSQVVVKAKKPLSKKNGKKRKSYGGSKKKKPSSLTIKTRRLSTLTSQKLTTERSKKQMTTTKKAKETTVVTCIPLKVVFSRVNEALKGSARQTQRRALPSEAKT